ncbi:Dolichyl pyrophosphate Glc1Man9GlcNAc2 alpha-1,3-glucosyltransferase [Thalictrum thalictroides]|uniref:Alpha-1,3-glucosyltransferase n=1 Tax=Thalictrum thalictroides TaxID=46969 RepID=A0A7J6UVI3_THATH|nr:Dolichyl pyrophosphate Glc1Man9GlcNAc2 alpha-1,3-glucosyltransferase [Thalictrum thalictroides]
MKKRRGKTDIKEGDGEDDDVWWLFQRGRFSSFLCISVFALLVRVLVSMNPYSGAGDPPKYGDYEAQRHWMEITLNTPVREWYRNTTSNNLSYWGLDYPPLTAYQSYAHSLFLDFFHPDSVALFTSRGHESSLGKLLMRLTVLSSDILIFFSAAIYFVILNYSNRGGSSKEDMAWNLAMILLNPCLILIDHGHFQYNCISLGLTLGAVAAIFSKHELVACALFSLALNHKQMSLYFAPAFFGHLLGKCLRHQNPFLRVTKLGLVVIGTFLLIWWPYLYSVNSVLEVLSRLAPFERGIYEDYVANFWCTSSILIKWKRLFTTQSLKLFSFVATMVALLPSMVQQIKAPSDKGFLYAMLNSSFSFYLFSFQVHEKSILLPLLPASLLVLEEPLLFKWLTYFGLFSMFPLLCRDQLILPYIALLLLFVLIYHSPTAKLVSRHRDIPGGWKALIMAFLLLCTSIIHVIYLVLKPPNKYPYLFEAMIMLLCCSQFVVLVAYTNIKQWKLNISTGIENEKKVQ